MAFVQRTGQTDILRSNKLPAVEIEIAPEFRYAGSTSFILYDVAHVEQHHFLVADAERRVLRRLWFQFEGFLESNNHTYTYANMDAITRKDLSFLHDTYASNVEEVYQARPTSDSAHVVDFLRDKGYVLSGDLMSHRMVWLDANLRNELMIIYSEALAPTGYSAADLSEDGRAAEAWADISKRLQERSLASFTIL